jgi:hypothetical protein
MSDFEEATRRWWRTPEIVGKEGKHGGLDDSSGPRPDMVAAGGVAEDEPLQPIDDLWVDIGGEG